jgi:hypothetical protein
MIFKPGFHGIRQIHGFSTEVNSRQTSRAFEILYDVSVTPCVANLRDSEKSDQLLFCHDSRAEAEFTILAW